MINRRIITVFLLGVSMFLIATNVQASLLFFVSAALFGVIAVSYAAPALAVRPVTVSRRVIGTAVEGEPITITGTVENGGRTARALLTIEDSLAPDLKPVVVWVPAGTAETVNYETALPRGVYEQADLAVSSAIPFGFVSFKRLGSPAAALVVVPAYEEIPTFPLLEALSSPSETVHERRSPGTGYDYLGVREYRPGDSLRVVHWKSSARRGELVVKEFEEEIASPVSLVIDGSLDCGRRGDSCLDAAARITASVANYCLRAGHPLQLFSQGEGGGHLYQPSLSDTLEWLAGIPGGASENVAALTEQAAEHFPARSTAVIITQAGSADWAGIADIGRDKRVRLIVILVAAESFDGRKPRAGDGLERTAALLAERRVTVYGYRKGESIRACLREPLTASSA